MLINLSVLAVVAVPFLAGSTFAATCPADAPEGYKWLSGYVDEFRANGSVNDWFTDSLQKNPEDFALLGLQAFFDANGDVAAARVLFNDRGGSDSAFNQAMACAKIQ